MHSQVGSYPQHRCEYNRYWARRPEAFKSGPAARRTCNQRTAVVNVSGGWGRIAIESDLILNVVTSALSLL